MHKIGIIGDPNYRNKLELTNLFKKLKDNFGNTPIILSGGNLEGVEYWTKRYALDNNMKYKEYNPSYTGHNLYSAMKESYYGKNYHPSHLYDRYKLLILESDYIFFFFADIYRINDLYKYCIKQAQKFNKTFKIIK